ncbi:MAG: hypothetical protein HGA74_10140 [Deltaproteobacteria bacterium]|nr:hypothetical protein [Deltaproteobacteria bacterium]
MTGLRTGSCLGLSTGGWSFGFCLDRGLSCSGAALDSSSSLGSSSSFVGAFGLASSFGLASGLGFGFKPGLAKTFPVSFWISLVASLKILSKISELSENGSFPFFSSGFLSTIPKNLTPIHALRRKQRGLFPYFLIDSSQESLFFLTILNIYHGK